MKTGTSSSWYRDLKKYVPFACRSTVAVIEVQLFGILGTLLTSLDEVCSVAETYTYLHHHWPPHHRQDQSLLYPLFLGIRSGDNTSAFQLHSILAIYNLRSPRNFQLELNSPTPPTPLPWIEPVLRTSATDFLNYPAAVMSSYLQYPTYSVPGPHGGVFTCVIGSYRHESMTMPYIQHTPLISPLTSHLLLGRQDLISTPRVFADSPPRANEAESTGFRVAHKSMPPCIEMCKAGTPAVAASQRPTILHPPSIFCLLTLPESRASIE